MCKPLPLALTCSTPRLHALRAATKADVSPQAGLALYRTIVKEYAERYGIGVEDALAYLRRNGITTHAAADDVGHILAAHMAGLEVVLLDSVVATSELALVSGYTQVLTLGDKAFDLVDKSSVDWLTHHTTYWIGDKSGPRLQGEIAGLVRTRMVEAGISSSEAGAELKALLGHQFNRDDLYWRGLAGNTASTGRNFGSVGAFEDVGAERYQILTALDERVCPICGEMDRMVFPVSAAVSTRNAMLETTDPTAIKDVHPWQSVASDRSSPEAVLANDGHMPPFHFLCRCLVGLA